MNFPKKLLITFTTYLIYSLSGVYAAGIDHYKVEFTPNTAKVGESIDLTIEAVDKNNNTVLDYDGTILIFSETDPEAELPSALEENTYTFSASDQGKIKFENSVIFKEYGIQSISIYDLNDDTVFGIAEANIEKSEVVLSNVEILILSPENGLTIGNDFITISGTTNKNHQVRITVNQTEEFTTTSNNDGIFEKTIKGLNDGDNIFKAQILDADGNVIGESEEVNIKIDLDSLSIRNISVKPEKVDPENSFIIELIANSGLTEASVIINDVITLLEEGESGVYTAKVFAPKEPGVYKIDATLKSELGHEKIELGSASITVNKIKLNSASIESKTEVKEEEEKEDDLQIKGLKLVELKTKSVLTWDKVESAESYNVYKKIKDGTDGELELIENVEDPKFEVEIIGDEIKYDYFAVKAVAKTASGELYEGSLSDATKVKTGPELLILLLISLMIGGFLFIRNNKNKIS